MRIIVTGAGGFVGRKLISLLSSHEVIGIDNVANTIPDFDHVTAIAGDLRDSKVLDAAFSDGCDVVIHLATVPGGAAEKYPDLAKQVNVDATMALADRAAKAEAKTRFVFASSIAALGNLSSSEVNDDTPLAPMMLYGAHKAMMEQWLATLTRRGELDAISLRLSGVVARPISPSGMKSAFMSDVFHAMSQGERFVMPVSKNASTWLSSLDTAASNFAHAVYADLEGISNTRSLTLPALGVRIGDLVAEIAKQTARSIDLVSYEPDTNLEAAFGSCPSLTTEDSRSLGFMRDDDLSTLVRLTLRNLTIN